MSDEDYEYEKEDDYDEYEDNTVYDDILTVGVSVASLEAGLAALHEFVLANHNGESYNYALLMQEGEDYRLVHRVGMPCWGALREYEKGTRPNDEWPDDLQHPRHIFPEMGNPVAVAACFQRSACDVPGVPSWAKGYSPTIKAWNTFIEFAFNKEISPWRKALKDVELVKNADGMYWGCVFKDTHIDPNIMLGLLRCNALQSALAKNFAQKLQDHPDLDPRIAYLSCKGIDSYNMAGRIIPERWWNGDPVDISGGKTFYDRESYNRPDIEYLFGGKKNEGVVFTDGWNGPSVDTIKALFA